MRYRFKILARFFGVLLLLLLVLGLSLQSVAVQQFLARKITASLSEQLQSEVAIEALEIHFIKSVDLKGLYAADQKGDTLLALDQLSCTIGLFSLLQKKIQLDEISINGLHTHLYNTPQDSTFNFQFLLDHFAGDTTNTPSVDQAPWQIGFGNIALHDTQFSFHDSLGQLYVNTQIPKLTLKSNAVDFVQQNIDLAALVIDQPQVAVSMVAEDQVDNQGAATVLAFPYFGWQIVAEEFSLQGGDVRYWVNNHPVKPRSFDTEHLHFSDLQLKLQDFLWDSTSLLAQLEDAAFQEHSGLNLQEGRAAIALSPQEISVQDLLIRTPSSQIQNTSNLGFTNWEALPDFLNQVDYQSAFTNSHLSLPDLDFFIPYLPAEYRIQSPVYLNGVISGVNGSVQLEQLDLQVGDFLDFRSSGKITHIDQPQQMQIDLNLEQLEVDYQTLRQQLPVLALPSVADNFGIIGLSGQVKGSLAEMQIQDLSLQTSTHTFLKANGMIAQLQQMEQFSFSLDIDSLHTQAEDLAYLTKQPLPSGLFEMEAITYQGLLSGNLHDFTTKGQLHTAIGQLHSDLHISFHQDYSNAAYDGDLELHDFNLGLFLADTATFGLANLDATIEGEGISLDSMDTELNAIINSFVFQNYDYQNIAVNGHLKQMTFLGDAEMKDPNLTFDFHGLVNLEEKRPRFDFNAEIDTIDFYALGLLPDSLRTSLKISSDFSGKTVDDFSGTTSIHNWHLSKAANHFHSDSMVLMVKEKSPQEKILSLDSDWLTANLSGQFILTDFPLLLQQFIHHYFPIDQLLAPLDASDSLAILPFAQSNVLAQDFRFSGKLIQPQRLSQIFTTTLKSADSIMISGNFNSAKKELNLGIESPAIETMGWSIDSLHWDFQGNADQISSTLLIPDLDNGATQLRHNRIDLTLADKQLSTNILVNNRQEQSVFAWAGKIRPMIDYYQISFADSLWVNQQLWTLDPAHDIRLNQSSGQCKDFVLRKEQQSVSVNSYAASTEGKSDPLEVVFGNFQLSELSALTNLEGFQYEALVNGKIQANDLTGKLHYLAEIAVDELVVNDSLIGNLAISATQNQRNSLINISVGLEGNGNNAKAVGSYNLDQNQFDVAVDIEKMPLILVDPFTYGAIQNSQGFIAGHLNLNGSPTKPLVNGTLSLQEASSQINYLQSRYSIPKHRIALEPDRIDFGRLSLLDSDGNQATLSGEIRHTHFQAFHLFLDFTTDKFKVLDTKHKDNDLFYGKLNVAANVAIRGTLENPQINVNAKTKAGSQIYVTAILEEELTQQAAYIIYGKPGELSLDSILQVRSESNEQGLALDVLLNLELTPELELIIVIDPATGDQLACKGNADLTVRMSSTGDLNINGLYTIVDGSYQFNYQNLVKRSFALAPGGRLNFIGDPLETRFDLKAKYKARTGIYSLIANESSLSETDIREAKERTDIEVILKIQGDLDQPLISFDLEVPELDDTNLNDLTNQKLVRLREEKSELNKQVFGLLLLNSFVAEQSASVSLSTTGENLALSSVSNLISNQLNQLSDQYAKGLGLTFDLESNRDNFSGESASTHTNLSVGLTQSLFNDRLKLKVGGVAQVKSNTDTGAGSGLSNIAGDFVLEYQLTPSGNYVLRVFQRSDYDALKDNNVSKTGVGISFKKAFGK